MLTAAELVAARRRCCICGRDLEGRPSQIGECWLDGRFYCPRCGAKAWAEAREKAARASATEQVALAPASPGQMRLWE